MMVWGLAPSHCNKSFQLIYERIAKPLQVFLLWAKCVITFYKYFLLFCIIYVSIKYEFVGGMMLKICKGKPEMICACIYCHASDALRTLASEKAQFHMWHRHTAAAKQRPVNYRTFGLCPVMVNISDRTARPVQLPVIRRLSLCFCADPP